MMSCGLLSVQQAAIGNCLSFDPFPFDQNGLASSEVDVGGGQGAVATCVEKGFGDLRLGEVTASHIQAPLVRGAGT
jgi:hypothetical protein